MSSQINVDIITEYKGRQNVKTAEKDFNTMNASLLKLGKAFAGVFAVQKLAAFGKASVAAFAADQKSAAILSQTLGNLGQAFANVPVEKFITNLSELNGIAKSDLRTSFDTLVRSTGNASKAQDLLSLGLDISAGTGKDLSLVTTALSKAYGGNFAALSKLGAGISHTLLATKDFAKMQQFLAGVFKGDASVAADSFAGKIARMKTAFEEFKITIGSGLVDAFITLANGTSIDTVQSKMQTVASTIADMIRGIGDMGAALLHISLPSWMTLGLHPSKLLAPIFTQLIAPLPYALSKMGASSRQKAADAAAVKAMTVPQGPFKEGFTTFKDHAKFLEIQKKELVNAKALTAEAIKKAAAERASLTLKLAGFTTDMQNIEIQAALQRGQTEQVTNVLLLQRAQITGNTDQMIILSQEVLKANGLVMDVSGNISSLAGAKDPFADWPKASQGAKDELDAMQASLDKLNMEAFKARVKAIDDMIKLLTQTVTVTVATVYSTGSGVGSPDPTTSYPPQDPYTVYPGNIVPQAYPKQDPHTVYPGNITSSMSGVNMSSGLYDSGEFPRNAGIPSNQGGSNNSSTPIAVTVNLNGQAVGNAITDAQVDNSASGIPSSFQRNYAGAW